MYDVLIIGAGPAGISASLYAKRANSNVLVLYYGHSSLEAAEKIDNYYGFKDGISGKELFENGIEQARKLGVDVKEEEIISVDMLEGGFIVKTVSNEYETKSIIISTGNKKVKPDISNFEDYEGRGISYCAICDGFFYRGKNVAIIGNGNFAINEARELKNIANKVTILSNGLDMVSQDEFEVDQRKINSIIGDGKVEKIEFEDGNTLDVDGLFIALGQAGGFDFAKKLGIVMNKDNIRVNEKMETNIPGVFAAGNITGGLQQISKSVYEGAQAGLSAIQYIRG